MANMGLSLGNEDATRIDEPCEEVVGEEEELLLLRGKGACSFGRLHANA